MEKTEAKVIEVTFTQLAWAVARAAVLMLALSVVAALVVQSAFNSLEITTAEVSFSDSYRSVILVWVAGYLFNWRR